MRDPRSAAHPRPPQSFPSSPLAHLPRVHCSLSLPPPFPRSLSPLPPAFTRSLSLPPRHDPFSALAFPGSRANDQPSPHAGGVGVRGVAFRGSAVGKSSFSGTETGRRNHIDAAATPNILRPESRCKRFDREIFASSQAAPPRPPDPRRPPKRSHPQPHQHRPCWPRTHKRKPPRPRPSPPLAAVCPLTPPPPPGTARPPPPASPARPSPPRSAA